MKDYSELVDSIIDRSDILKREVIQKPRTAAEFTNQFYDIYEQLFNMTNRNIIKQYVNEDTSSMYHILVAMISYMENNRIISLFSKFNKYDRINLVLDNSKPLSQEEKFSDIGIVHFSTIKILKDINDKFEVNNSDLETLLKNITLLYYYSGIKNNSKNYIEKDKTVYHKYVAVG